ncbi:MAG: hypothetical protein JRJ09_08405 [Deltaproteobacteria bacterium]|nr:hypothetical protein [Deltaproteobacteria bacterium]MBW2048534.1 hypothetical protein [Deltaproteobacteria bacterium]MBW2110925.1 hypothetical protein [Deltaproteobacteria bacterium]MBW2353295.1 hypothetical protein [Deltaproteobacteria bacterium]
MTTLLYIIALSWIVAGTSLILFTEKTMAVFEKMFHTPRVKGLSFLPLSLGVVLVVGAFSRKDLFWLIFILGLLALLKGVYFYMAPPRQVTALMEWWFTKARPETLRAIGLTVFVLGLALFSYSG